MAKPLSDFYENLRAALSDQGTAGAYAYRNESLDGALRTIIETGLGPRGVLLNEAKTHLDPEPATPDARGYLVFQSALFIIGGQIPFSFKTRAMSVHMNPAERALTVDHLRRQIKRLETEGDPHNTGRSSRCFGVWADFENAICRLTTPERTH